MQSPSAILETVIYATDIDAAERFYQDVFGLEVVRKLPEQFVFFRCGQQMLLIFNADNSIKNDINNPLPRHGTTGSGHFCFAAKDEAEVLAWRGHFTSRGIAIEHYHRWPNNSVSVYIRDPAGNSVEVGETQIWTDDAS